MGSWGSAPWENDDAADWFCDLFNKTKLAKHVEKALKRKDVEEYADEIRAAAFVLLSLGRVYIWPTKELERHLKLAVKKLEAIQNLEDFAGDEALVAEISELRSRIPE